MTPRLARLLDALAPVVREEITKDFMPDCCIATGAILRRVFRHFHFHAMPVPVLVYIYNAAYVKLRDTPSFVFPTDQAELHALMDKTGAWGMGITEESARPGKWAGHLLMRVQDALVDASLDFCNRPAKNIVLPPFIVTPARRHFLEFRSQLAGTVDGCEIVYQRQHDQSYRTAPDWSNESRGRRAVNAIIDRAKALLIRSSENGNSDEEGRDLEGGSVAAREDRPLPEQSAGE
jgi:hypothetical protein